MTRSQVFVVLGMHRSGTSALAGVLNELGVNFGRKLIEASKFNAKGYYELEPMVALNDHLLAQACRVWNDPARLDGDLIGKPCDFQIIQRMTTILDREFAKEAGAVGLKDPRLCRLLPLWTPVLERFACQKSAILCIRRPGEVADSLARRDAMPRDQALALWLRYVLDAEQYTRGWQRACVEHSKLVSEPVSVFQDLAGKLGYNFMTNVPEPVARITRFIDPRLTTQVLEGGQHYSKVSNEIGKTYEENAERLFSILRDNPLDTLIDEKTEPFRVWINEEEKRAEPFTNSSRLQVAVHRRFEKTKAYRLAVLMQRARNALR